MPYIEPYYETDLGTLYHDDCIRVIPFIGKVDLVLTDPPYGINENNEKNLSRGGLAKPKDYGSYDWDSNKIHPVYIYLLKYISKNQIVFGGNYYGSMLGDTNCYIVWNKENASNHFADCELAWTSFKTAVRKIDWLWMGMIKLGNEKRYHPTQKPTGLFVQIIEKYSGRDDIILDPFMGSGTTALACEKTNRRWIGIEKEEKYCEIIQRRLEAEIRQKKLFG